MPKPDSNYLCAGCGGTLEVVDTLPDGRKVYDCSSCHNNRMPECSLCHLPRTTASGIGVCLSCFMLVQATNNVTVM